MEDVHFEVIGEALCSREVTDLCEGIVGELIWNGGFGQFSRQPVVAIEVELESEGTPCKDAQIAQTKDGVDEVAIVVEALARIGFEEGLLCGFVMPWFVGGHSFCVTETGKRPLNDDAVPTGENPVDTIFMAFDEGCHCHLLFGEAYHDIRRCHPVGYAGLGDYKPTVDYPTAGATRYSFN